jgi:hypothetical protein
MIAGAARFQTNKASRRNPKLKCASNLRSERKDQSNGLSNLGKGILVHLTVGPSNPMQGNAAFFVPIKELVLHRFVPNCIRIVFLGLKIPEADSV